WSSATGRRRRGRFCQTPCCGRLRDTCVTVAYPCLAPARDRCVQRNRAARHALVTVSYRCLAPVRSPTSDAVLAEEARHDPVELGGSLQARKVGGPGDRHALRVSAAAAGLPHPRVGDARMNECDRGPFSVDVERDAHASSANKGRTNSSNVSRSQLATVTGVSARTEAVRGICIASATSPK